MCRDKILDRGITCLGNLATLRIACGRQIPLRRIDNPKAAIELPCPKLRQIHLQIRRPARVNFCHIGQRNIDMGVEGEGLRMDSRSVRFSGSWDGVRGALSLASRKA